MTETFRAVDIGRIEMLALAMSRSAVPAVAELLLIFDSSAVCCSMLQNELRLKVGSETAPDLGMDMLDNYRVAQAQTTRILLKKNFVRKNVLASGNH